MIETETYYIIEFSPAGENDWCAAGGSHFDKLESAKSSIDYRKGNRGAGRFDYRVVKRTITDEVVKEI